MIYKFIKNITKNENLDLSDTVIDRIQQIYNSDIRSMINFIQLNQNITIWEDNIVTDEVWENIHVFLKIKTENGAVWSEKINEISNKFNLDKKSILKNYFNYIIRKKPEIISDKFLTILEMLMHSNDSNIDHILQYFVLHISAYISV